MSIEAMNWVWKHSKHKGSERLLLLALADNARDEDFIAWPGLAKLREKTLLSERNVRYLLRKLEEAGSIVTVIGGSEHGTNLYRIIGGQTLPPANFAGGQPSVESGATQRRGVGQSSVKKRPRIAPKPSVKPPEEPPKNQGGISSEIEGEYLAFLTARGVYSISDYRSKYHMPDTDPAMMVRRIRGVERKSARRG